MLEQVTLITFFNFLLKLYTFKGSLQPIYNFVLIQYKIVLNHLWFCNIATKTSIVVLCLTFIKK